MKLHTYEPSTSTQYKPLPKTLTDDEFDPSKWTENLQTWMARVIRNYHIPQKMNQVVLSEFQRRDKAYRDWLDKTGNWEEKERGYREEIVRLNKLVNAKQTRIGQLQKEKP